MTETREKICQDLYEEYKTIAARSRVQIYDYEPGKPMESQMIFLEDLQKREKLRIQLLEKCRDFVEKLSPEEVFELENG